LLQAAAAQAAEIDILSREDGVMDPAVVTIKAMPNQGDAVTFRKTFGTIRSAIVLASA
jgi:hypothetical protein